MNTFTQRSLPLLGVGLALALMVGPAEAVGPAASSHRVPQRTAVTGYFDWTIVPVNLAPYLIVGADGDLYVRHLPLVGPLTLTGRGISLEAKIQVDFNAEFDATGTGVGWAPVIVTGTVEGVKTILFEGQARVHEVNLNATGSITLEGRGPYAGAALDLAFQEIGPGDSNTYTCTGVLMPVPRR